MTAWTQAAVDKAQEGRKSSRVRNEQPPPAPMEPPKETEPAKRLFRYEVAKGIHTEQFPDRFRIVVIGPVEEKEAVEAALQVLKDR